MIKHRNIPVLVASLSAMLGAISTQAQVVVDRQAIANEADGTNWLSHGRTYSEQNFSPLRQIDTGNVRGLGLAWSLDLKGERSLEGTPLSVNGVLYVTGSMSTVYAVNATDGKLLWKFDPESGKRDPRRLRQSYQVNRGAAFWKDKVFVGTTDGRLIALRADTGSVVWSTDTVAGYPKQSITGAPRVFNGKVVIGNSGADVGGRGYVTAYDTETGRQAWRFFTVPGNPADGFEDDAMRMAAQTWHGEWWRWGGGGTVWNGITYDPELNQLYLGVGNAGPWNPRLRSPGGGDNLFVASIVALNADTGKYLWHYQTNPGEAWDFKATADLVQADLIIAGRPRKVLMQLPTNGFFYVLDRITGKLISAEKVGKVTWADRVDLATGRPVEAPNIRYENGPVTFWPSPFGAHSWQSMSFNPVSGLVYIPYMKIGARFKDAAAQDTATLSADQRKSFVLAGMRMEFVVADRDDGTGALLAWDPVANKTRWKVEHPTLWNGGVMSTAGDLVFQGTADGHLRAYEAAEGRQLWDFDAKLGISSSPITYQANGVQYVSILVGYGGASNARTDPPMLGWKFDLQPRRLLTFALGKATPLPFTAPPDTSLQPLDDPQLTIDEHLAQEGMLVYGKTCGPCHGNGLVSSGSPAPDLRESTVAVSWGSFDALLKSGALASRGMPRYDDLSEEEKRSVFMAIRKSAREAAARHDEAPAPSAHERIKLIELVGRRSDLTHLEFLEHLSTTHLKVVDRVPEFRDRVRQYMQNHLFVDPGDLSGIKDLRISFNADSIIEVWWDSVDDIRRAFDEPRYKAVVRPDELSFGDVAGAWGLTTHDTVVMDRKDLTGPMKIFVFLRRTDNISHSEFLRRWRNAPRHRLMAARAFRSYVGRFIENEVAQDPHDRLPGMKDYDLVAEMWFPSLQEIAKFAVDRDVVAALMQTGSGYTDKAQTLIYVAEEKPATAEWLRRSQGKSR
jgi:quinohemoprotein ethanol dehydrogenase